MPAPKKSIRPKARSKTAVMKSVRPPVRPKTVDVSPKAEKGDQEHVKPMAKGGKAKKKTTTRMPSGAQQYVRGNTAADRISRLADMASAERSRNRRGRMSEAEFMLTDGLIDEVDDSLRGEAARRTEREVGGRKSGGQMKTKKMAKGGMARGCGSATKGKRYSRSG